jgi:hypothetical protein
MSWVKASKDRHVSDTITQWPPLLQRRRLAGLFTDTAVELEYYCIGDTARIACGPGHITPAPTPPEVPGGIGVGCAHIQDLGAPNLGISTSSISASGPSAGRSLA